MANYIPADGVGVEIYFILILDFLGFHRILYS